MDVTEELDFRTVFPADNKNPYSRIIVDKIQANRALLDNELFFDNLLVSFAKLTDVSSHYPPRSIATLKALFNLITTSQHLDSLKKHTLIYYLLLDLPSRRAASDFASRVHLPHNFIDLITALHCLDTLSLSDALQHLTSPAITPPAPEKILKTLYKHGGASMVTTFMSCVQPELESPESVEIFFTAQMELSPEGAFLYARTGALGHLKATFLKKLITYCITVNPAVNALKLLNLPFEEDEKHIFVEALKGSGLEVARDTLMVWQMHQGRVNEVLKGTRKAAARGEVDGLDWGILGEGLRRGVGGRGGLET
ncbi:hypothetical protein K440DRAFT_594435 [Wilcoxina mikolae CBS 423.85]|nr:hypothetical protein K440DRAFT_594435 [Wilcoxina mikolae CBS 423.85]